MTVRVDVPPIVAILRGVHPDEIVAVAGALVAAGIRAIEIPLNSPDPYTSLRRLHDAYGTACLCGAGTVLTPVQVERVRDSGGSLVVAPNADVTVVARAVELGLVPMPGFMTPSEAFAALAAGARHLKMFPAATCGTAHLQALRAVLPQDAHIFAVGGVGPGTIADWRRAGAHGVGIGSDIYRPGQSAQQVAQQAAAIVAAARLAGWVC